MSPVDTIIREVADEHVVESVPCRRRDLVDARSEAAHRLFEETDLRLWQIGEVLGGRHHSSVIHLLRRHDTAMMVACPYDSPRGGRTARV